MVLRPGELGESAMPGLGIGWRVDMMRALLCGGR
jgi:hypothetical protein